MHAKIIDGSSILRNFYFEALADTKTTNKFYQKLSNYLCMHGERSAACNFFAVAASFLVKLFLSLDLTERSIAMSIIRSMFVFYCIQCCSVCWRLHERSVFCGIYTIPITTYNSYKHTTLQSLSLSHHVFEEMTDF